MNYRDADLIRRVFANVDRGILGDIHEKIKPSWRYGHKESFLDLWDAMVAYIQEAEAERETYRGEERG